ncbi:uncharacterized protein KY384_001022 [Bacidia gigantensis]|uniref:uncharacterized protein n=1 Tax=Bacidia gigantensis TaxID=2732470 RepID=UPI001D04BFAF|nr:uncharacterized protein KY384_001022 [Bacidia gigantensis]KAG8534178.1 hypothetical protein KY384_001022 [Bacidia gigantensis]
MADKNGRPEQPAPTAEELSETAANDNESQPRTRSSTQSSGRLRSASLKFLESSPPLGFLHAAGTTLAQAPTPMEIRRGDYGHDGWDGAIQRRNGSVSEESTQRLTRQTTAQTLGGITRTRTIPLQAHPETEEEGHQPRPEAAGTFEAQSTSASQATMQKRSVADDDDDPFSKFIGRGRIDSQVFDPKTKIVAKELDGTTEPPPEQDDDLDSLDELDPRPKKRLSKLPNKFVDPTGDAIPQPDEKAGIVDASAASSPTLGPQEGPDADGLYPNGYKFPPKHSWGEATLIGLKAFWKFTITPFGFLVVLYGLNVVAWGGMLFLLLIGGGEKYMCFPPNKPPGYKACNNINAPRRVWIEIDSQILNALFCVTGFGLIPWRFRDLYYLLQYRIRGKQSALRKLGGIHRAWFRLPAPATKLWRLDYVIWAYVLNTFLQAVLSGFMWGLNRYDRPSWSTGTFVALACIVAALGGLMSFQEGKKVKAVEGIPLSEEEVLKDIEKQVVHGKKVEVKKAKNQDTKKRFNMKWLSG